MSDDLSFDLVDAAQEIYVHNLLNFFAISFFFYDHLITLGNEVSYLWLRPKSQSTYWFFFNRYFAFLGNLLVTVLEQTNLSPDSSLVLIMGFLLTLRIYALYNCSFRILAYMVSSGVVLSVIACWSLFGQKSAPAQELPGCHIGLSHITSIHLAGAWEALFVYDSILFGLTMFKTWKNRNEFILSQIQNSLIYLFLRDGAIYFAVMALANLANISTFYFCGPFMRGGLSTFASGISVTMISRLMLNLHENANAGIYSTVTSTQIISTHMECYSPPVEIELDAIRTGDTTYHSTITPV